MKPPSQLPTVGRGTSRASSHAGVTFGPHGIVDSVVDFGTSVVSSPNFWKGVGGATTIAGAIASALAGK